MPTSKYLRWLKEDQLTTKVAKRFASFCEEDIEQRAKSETFDADIYEAAVRLVLDKLENKEGDDGDDDKNEKKDKPIAHRVSVSVIRKEGNKS